MSVCVMWSRQQVRLKLALICVFKIQTLEQTHASSCLGQHCNCLFPRRQPSLKWTSVIEGNLCRVAPQIYIHPSPCSSHSAVAFNHVLFIDLTVAAASYQGFAKFSVALSPGSNWSLPEANWLDSSDMSKSISQLNGAGRWRAFIATTAAACRLWPCGETEFQVSTFNSPPCLNVHGLLSTRCPRMSSSYVMWSVAWSRDAGRLIGYQKAEGCREMKWQLIWVTGDSAANPQKDSTLADREWK